MDASKILAGRCKTGCNSANIVEQLREAAELSLNEYGEADRYREAADEIERLKAIADTVDIMTAQAIKRQNDEIEQLSEQLAEATAEIEKLRELWENSPSAAR